MYILKFLASIIKLFHVFVITVFCKKLTEKTPGICAQGIMVELGLTFVSIIISKKHRFDVLQLPLSLFLSYQLLPNNYVFMAGIFFFKLVYIFNILGEVIDDLFSAPGNNLTRISKITLSIIRYTLVEYLFLGLVILGYKLWTRGDPEGELPEDYIILYKLIVTATTIGYGDFTPKTHYQIEYFTYAIPFICASFVIYFNAVIPTMG